MGLRFGFDENPWRPPLTAQACISNPISDALYHIEKHKTQSHPFIRTGLFSKRKVKHSRFWISRV